MKSPSRGWKAGKPQRISPARERWRRSQTPSARALWLVDWPRDGWGGAGAAFAADADRERPLGPEEPDRDRPADKVEHKNDNRRNGRRAVIEKDERRHHGRQRKPAADRRPERNLTQRQHDGKTQTLDCRSIHDNAPTRQLCRAECRKRT